MNKDRLTPVTGLVGVILSALFVVFFLRIDNQTVLAILLAVGIIVIATAARLGVTRTIGRAFSEHENVMNAAVFLSILGIGLVFHSDYFVLLMLTSVLIFTLACLGLNIQFGYVGILNFAAAASLVSEATP